MPEPGPGTLKSRDFVVWNIHAVDWGPILIVSVKLCTINHGGENNLVVFVHHMRHTLSPNDSFDKLVSACVRENFSNILTFTLSASCPTPVSGIYYQHNLENKYFRFRFLFSPVTIIFLNSFSRLSDWQNLLTGAFSFPVEFCIVVLILLLINSPLHSLHLWLQSIRQHTQSIHNPIIIMGNLLFVQPNGIRPLQGDRQRATGIKWWLHGN